MELVDSQQSPSHLLCKAFSIMIGSRSVCRGSGGMLSWWTQFSNYSRSTCAWSISGIWLHKKDTKLKPQQAVNNWVIYNIYKIKKRI